jgi:TatD DNase family protein
MDKPMIIHCVRSFDQLIAWRKGKNVNMLVHGFNRKIALLKDLIKAGFYLSFGAAIFEDVKALVNCPPEKLFLETDDQDKYSIEEIYNKTAEVLNTDVELLKLQILENRKTFFKL